jgi:hypothetical protein
MPLLVCHANSQKLNMLEYQKMAATTFARKRRPTCVMQNATRPPEPVLDGTLSPRSLDNSNGLRTFPCRLIKRRANVGGSTREEPPTPGGGKPMRNSGEHAACALLIGLMLMAGAPARGQESVTVRSLGELARQLKAERAKEKQKPITVYTNDNLPSRGSLGIAAVEPEEGTKEKAQATAENIPKVGEEHGEKYFRSSADKIRSQMEFHQRQLAVLKQQMGLARMQYYPDPQKTLEQESTPAFQTDVDKLRAKIADAEKAVADDQKAMDDLQQELRRADGDPGWIR